MGRLTCWTCLVILAVSLSQFQIAEACSCSLDHPQTQFCRSDFVAVVSIRSIDYITEYRNEAFKDGGIAYTVEVNRTLKATPNATLALEREPVWLWTASTDAMCGRVDLKVGEMWIVGGRMSNDKLRITLCSLAMLLLNVTPRQYEALEELYNGGCECEITKYPDATACHWDTSLDSLECKKLYGVCLSNSTGCYWQHDETYENCTAQYQRDPYSVVSRSPDPNVHISF